MKELSIKEKAKRYDEAKEKAKVLKECSTNTEAVGYMDELFPELGESEDERIRKGIIEYLRQRLDRSPSIPAAIGSWIAWLEKQGEQILANSVKTCKDEQNPVFEMKTPEESLGIDSDTYNKIVDECIYGEQKPAWSEEDEGVINHLLAICAGAKRYRQFAGCLQEDITKYQTWLKSLKERVRPRPKQEWSKEDESRIDNLCHFLEEYGNQYYGYLTLQGTISWLKSIRPQNTWKPSELQIEALESATENCAYSEYQDCLRELIGRLKKLKG